MSRQWRVPASCLLLLFLVAGCYLVSGERAETRVLEGDLPGSHTVRFVSADGQRYQKIAVGPPNAPLVVELSAATEQGQLTVGVLDRGGDPVFATTASMGLAEVVSGTVRTDEEGRLSLLIEAIEAHSGSYTVRFRLAAPLTPTPTSPPSVCTAVRTASSK